MLKVLGCVAFEHNLALVGLSAVICALGCFTTCTLMARTATTNSRRPLFLAATMFGCSVWSLHFVAMLAFTPSRRLTYDVQLTTGSALVAAFGALAALFVWRSALPNVVRIVLGGIIFGLAVGGMHYVGVQAMTVSSVLSFDTNYVAASILVGIVFFVVALARAADLRSAPRRVEVAGWMALAICGLHFTGMSATTVAPLALTNDFGVLGSTALATSVGGISVLMLVTCLAAVLIEQHMSDRTLRELARMRLMSNLAQEVLIIESQGMVLEVNSAGERLFKASASEIVGRPLGELIAQESAAALTRRVQSQPCERLPEEIVLQASDGTKINAELTCQPIDYMGRSATVFALRDLSDRRRDEARIRHLARHDALTGLPNRHALMERLDTHLASAEQSGQGVAVIFIDLDRFKPVNDMHGHSVGDKLLVQVSKRVRAEICPADMLARIGGDEFVMLLADPSPERASAVATAVLQALAETFQIEGRRIEIGASIGVALYPDDGTTADALLRAADAAMYQVKEDGRGALRFYEPAMNANLQTRLQLEQELAGAARRGELALVYQPIVNGSTGALEEFEALIRWNNPRCGMVSPAEFIPIAERAGLIDGIGRWVIDTACKEASTWSQPWRISVNLSPRQFHNGTVLDVVRNALAAHALAPSRLCVEVTESVMIDDAVKAVATLTELRKLGIRIALDDFGTGFSSLAYLQLFRFDKFKIDKSFVNRLGQSADALTLTRSIITLGHNLGLHVTAEGVEHLSQLDTLKQLGCNQIQGYLIGRPSTVQAFNESERSRTAGLFNRNEALVPA